MEAKDESRGGWLARWRAPRKQEQRLATLQEGFSELVGLTRSIREHMEQQAHMQRTLVEMMAHIPGAVEGLKSVGRATEQQTQTLNLLKQQLESAARNEQHMADSMVQFQKTLSVMGEMSQNTTRTVTSMAERAADSDAVLRRMLERSEKRLVYMIVSLMVLAVAVVGAGWYITRSADPEVLPPPPSEMDELPFESDLLEQEALVPVLEPEAEEPVLGLDEADAQPADEAESEETSVEEAEAPVDGDEPVVPTDEPASEEPVIEDGGVVSDEPVDVPELE